MFTRDLLPLNNRAAKVPAVRNLLLFGPAGSGKSSFVNSCFSMFSSCIQWEIATTGGPKSPVTSKLQSYRVIDVTRRKRSCIRLWDTPGFHETLSYSTQEFLDLLTGEYKSGWFPRNRNAVSPLRARSSRNESATANLLFEAAPSCVLFFVTAEDVAKSPNGEAWNALAWYVLAAQKEGERNHSFS